MVIMTPPNPRPNALRWVRETLDLSQSEMASRLGCTEATIRSIESGRRKFSRKFASRLAEQTGLDVGRLMRNEIEDASPADVRNAFLQAQKGEGTRADFSPGGRVSEILPHALLRQSFVLQELIVEELGPAGCLYTGFYDVLQKMNAKLLWKISNTKTRQRGFPALSRYGKRGSSEALRKGRGGTQGSCRRHSQQHEKTPLSLVAIW